MDHGLDKTGFAMVIFSAALRGVPQETVEAAIIDGANPRQLFLELNFPNFLNSCCGMDLSCNRCIKGF